MVKTILNKTFFGTELPIIQTPMAVAVGVDDFTPLWCGENISSCSEIPAAELTRLLVTEL